MNSYHLSRILTFALLLGFILNACKTDNSYLISGKIYNDEDTFVLFIDGNRTDTIPVIDKLFIIEGSVDTVHLVHIKLPSYPRKQEFILEPGEINISYESKKTFLATGAPNNDSYNEYKQGMDSETTRVLEAYQVYKKKETAEAKAEALQAYDDIEEERRVFMRAQLRKNPNITGLMILKTIHKTDSIENLGPYLESLKEFEYTEIYKEVFAYNKAITSTLPGMPSPKFVLPDSTGNMIQLQDFQGQYVLLDFWFTGCTYCDMLVPHLKNIYADLHSKGLEIMDISVDKENSKWLMTVNKKNSPWIHLHDADKKVSSSFGMPGFPTLILIDKDGKVAKRLVGYRDEAQLRSEILSVMN